MTKRLVFVVLLAILLLIPQISYAQDKITVVDSTTQVFFPSALVFNIEAQSLTNITRIRLNYQVHRINYAQVISEVWPDFAPAAQVKTRWVWDMRRASLPAGAEVKYWWTIEDEAGNRLTTEADVVHFDDLRYSWQRLTQGQLNLHWYSGNEASAKELMAASQMALGRLTDDTGVYPDKPINIYIYANSKDLQGAMIFPREWTGGSAFPEYSIITIGLSSGDKNWDKKALAHELGHLALHQITFSPYGALLPTWLDEGFAMHAEGELDQYLQSYLKNANAEDELISVRSLSSPFSARTEEAYLSYAESQSIVEFLIQSYGKDKMLLLLDIFKEGSTTDEALIEVYGFDQDELDSLWRKTLTALEKPETRELHTEIVNLSFNSPDALATQRN